MPKHETKFNRSWLEKTDLDGTPVKRWLKQDVNPSTFICTICKTDDLSCGNKGWKFIEQHMNIKKHRDNLKLIKENSSFIIQAGPTASSGESSASSHVSTVTFAHPTKSISFSDQVTRAETLWTINTARQGYSYLSCDDCGDLFRKMFPDSKIAENFRMERTKLSYVISHGLGPHFHRDLIQDGKRCERFVLCFDEQKNHQNAKQLDLLLKYWSVEKHAVVTRYYKSALLGHAPASVIRDFIIDSFRTDGIDIKHLLMISRDNANVNKTIEKLIDIEMKKVGGELLKIGSCPIHLVHNSFKSGTTASHWHVENICTDIRSWFHHSPARKEDFIKIADELSETMGKTILYFVATRWVLLGKVTDRVLAQWEVLNEYFLAYLPENHKTQIKENKKYNSIKSSLSSHLSKTRLLFISFFCRSIFEKLLTWLQRRSPLIHLLYQELSDFYRTVLLSFLTVDCVGNKHGAELLSTDHKIAEKQLNEKQIRIGEQARKSLSLLSKDEKEKLFQDVRNMFHSIASYLKLNLPLNNAFLRDLQILDFSRRSDPQGSDAIIRIGRSIPGLLSSNEIDLLSDEWLMYSIETIDQSWFIKRRYKDSEGEERIEYHDIDFYWNKVFSISHNNGQFEYLTLSKLIKNVLIIYHGNADVERGFSINGNILTEERTLLSEKSVNGLRTTFDAVQFLGDGSAYKMPISIDMLRMVQKSAAVYKEEALKMKALTAAHLKEKEENEKKEVEKKKLYEQEKELMSKYKKLQLEQKTAQLLLEEANERLENSLKKGDFTDVQAAYALNKAGTEKMKSIDEEMIKIMESVSKLQQKRAHTEHEPAKKIKISS